MNVMYLIRRKGGAYPSPPQLTTNRVYCHSLCFINNRHLHINVYTIFYTSHYILPYLFQLVYGQCFLSVGLTQFQNLYSLEIGQDHWGNDIFCCCDAATCYYNANQFSLDTCESRCDTYFILSFSKCQDLPPCSVIMMTCRCFRK